MMGRPSKYNDAILQEICKRLSEGETLASICRDDKMPHAGTVRDWMNGEVENIDAENVSRLIARARELGFDAIAQEALDIADETGRDTIRDENGKRNPDSEWISRSRLRVETRLKLLAKWDPKRYGEKQLLGSDPDNPLPAGFNVRLVKPDDGEVT
jgi:hypothetical protein